MARQHRRRDAFPAGHNTRTALYHAPTPFVNRHAVGLGLLADGSAAAEQTSPTKEESHEQASRPTELERAGPFSQSGPAPAPSPGEERYQTAREHAPTSESGRGRDCRRAIPLRETRPTRTATNGSDGALIGSGKKTAGRTDTPKTAGIARPRTWTGKMPICSGRIGRQECRPEPRLELFHGGSGSGAQGAPALSHNHPISGLSGRRRRSALGGTGSIRAAAVARRCEGVDFAGHATTSGQ